MIGARKAAAASTGRQSDQLEGGRAMDESSVMGANDDANRPGSLAAMSVCESLMIALVEKGLLEWEEVSETLESAIETHCNAEPEGPSREDHARAAEMIAALLRKTNALRARGAA